MNLIKIYTNENSIVSLLKNSNIKVEERLPSTVQEIRKCKMEYESILYIVNTKFLKEEELGQLCRVLNESSPLLGSCSCIQKFIVVGKEIKCNVFQSIKIGKLYIDLCRINNLINTIINLKTKIIESNFNFKEISNLTTFLKSINQELLFYGDFTGEDLYSIKNELQEIFFNKKVFQRNNNVIILVDKDFCTSKVSMELYRHIKKINSYCETKIIKIKSNIPNFIEIYGFKDKKNSLRIYTSIKELRKENKFKKYYFENSIKKNCNLYVVTDSKELKNIKRNSKHNQLTISTNLKDDLQKVDAIIDKDHIVPYLKLIQDFKLRNIKIAVADLQYIFTNTRGKLSYYKKYSLKKEEQLEKFKKDISDNDLKGVAILYTRNPDFITYSEYLKPLKKVYKELKVILVFPKVVYGAIEENLELFVFN